LFALAGFIAFRRLARDLADGLDARTGKRFQPRAHQRIGGGLVAQALVARRRLLAERGLAFALRDAHDPALGGPIAEQLPEPVREIAGRTFRQANLDAAGLEAHEADVR